jgi:ferric-dicitrate binding protein FerR (iron transport regulator)
LLCVNQSRKIQQYCFSVKNIWRKSLKKQKKPFGQHFEDYLYTLVLSPSSMDTHYTEPEQLLADESFLSWYFRKEGGEDWDNRIKNEPGLARLVEEASVLLETVRLHEGRVSAHRLQAAEEALFRRIAATAEDRPVRRPLYGYKRWMAAAAILVVLAGAVVVTVRIAGDRQVRTAYGQIAERRLPDGTEVMLDANSRLTYPTGWKDGVDREVWIKGEVFFHVRRTPSKSRFIVHTDHFDIIVTGTQFNVVNRHGNENVLLQEGSVVLRETGGKEMVLKPGDFVRFQASDLERSPVKTDSVMAWKDQKLVFNRTPLRELIAIVNDHYGVNLQLQDPSLGDSTITAILPNNNLDVLLQSLEATSEFDIIRKDDQIKIVAHQGQNQ